jgi:hypothetical protein
MRLRTFYTITILLPAVGLAAAAPFAGPPVQIEAPVEKARGPASPRYSSRARSLAIDRRIYGEQCSRATPSSLQVIRNRTASTSTSATSWRSRAGFGLVSPISF